MKFRTFIPFVLLAWGTSIMFAQEINLEQDLVARYLFEGNARNEVEDRNHGIETNVQYATDRDGQPNHCLYLTGDNSFVTILHTEDLNWDARTESYSIVFWTRSVDPRQGEVIAARIITKWSELLTDPYPYSFAVGDTVMHAAIREVGMDPLLCTVNGIWDDQWHHVAMLYNHELSQMTLYYDGRLHTSGTLYIQTDTKNTLDIQIGKAINRNHYFKGSVDDVYFYNRAIEACEVEALFSGQLLQGR